MSQLTLFDSDELLLGDDERGRVTYRPRFVEVRIAEAWFAELRHGVTWRSERRMMYDREVDVPRLMGHFRLDPVPDAAPAAVHEAARLVIDNLGVPFNSVGLNLYRDGRDSVAPHNDHLNEIGEGFPIALVSLGATRRMTIRDVAHHLDVGWDLVKDIQKRDLSRRYAKPKLKHLRALAIDEIAVAKGHRYLTVVMDLESGAVVFVGDGKGADALKPFWKRLRPSGAKIAAVAMDMSAAYRSAVSIHLPKAVIVFDHLSRRAALLHDGPEEERLALRREVISLLATGVNRSTVAAGFSDPIPSMRSMPKRSLNRVYNAGGSASPADTPRRTLERSKSRFDVGRSVAGIIAKPVGTE